MPYASDAQRKYFNANRAKLEAQGVNVNEYNKASKGMDLPARKSKARGIAHSMAHGGTKVK
jgi:hypothetical protein